jgi:hypothetical protein
MRVLREGIRGSVGSLDPMATLTRREQGIGIVGHSARSVQRRSMDQTKEEAARIRLDRSRIVCLRDAVYVPSI